MIQQINLYQPEFLPQTDLFPVSFMLWAAGIVIVAMSAIYGFAWQGVGVAEKELQIVSQQELAAIRRLENLNPLFSSLSGERSWPEQLDDALQNLQERQAVLTLVQGATRSETQGFSRHLRALARQDVDGIWLTHIVLTALDNGTRLEGRALRAELIPLYVQDLTATPPFAAQRFNRFRIDAAVDDGDYALYFSMDTENLLAAAGSKP